MAPTPFRFFTATTALLAGLGTAWADLTSEPVLQSFLEAHCYDCHDEEVQKGGLDLATLSKELSDEAAFARWVLVHDRVASGEMPPAKKERPPKAAALAFREVLATRLEESHQADKGTVLRRLNRREYENTINDLFGIRLDAGALLPQDGRAQEFDVVGSALGISMEQMEQYVIAARQAIDAALAKNVKPPEVVTIRADYAKTQEGEKHVPSAWGRAPDGATVFYRALGYPTGMLRDSAPKTSGRYKVRVTGYAYQSDRPITFMVGGTSFGRGTSRPIYGFHSFPPGQPTTVEFETEILQNYMIEIVPWGLHDEEGFIRAKKSTDGYPGPGLAINHVEIIGPLVEEFPSRGHRLLVGDLERNIVKPAQWNKDAVFEIADADEAGITDICQKLAATLFRRPVTVAETQPYLELYRHRLEAGDGIEDAIRVMATALLCAPDFLYLRETPGALGDHALASRLSYFLHRSTPDQRLRTAADQGLLRSDPKRLRSEARRLMAAPSFERFLKDFCDAWLDLRDIDETAPDRKLFPEHDRFLQYSMLIEAPAYLRELLEKNRPAREIVKADYALLNNRLVTHYGLPDELAPGPEFRRVSLPADSIRGGFLSQAGVLKVTANGTNTSPVMRGVWVMDRLLGDPPSPPPPGTPGVEPDTRGAETLRELLDKHRDTSSCNACHRKIDPPGFALEEFNPIGQHRARFRTTARPEKDNGIEKSGRLFEGRNVRYYLGPPVDSSGVTPKGEAFSGFAEFRDVLAKDDRTLARTFVTKLLIFATGREMGFSDRAPIEAILDAHAAKGYLLGDLLESCVASPLFLEK